MKRIGYAKIGRVIEVDPARWGASGGDNEPPALLLTLANRHPDVMWVCVGRNSGWTPPLPNIENPWQSWIPYVKPFGNRLYRVQDQSVETYNSTVQFYDNLIGPTYDGLDGMIVWCGQHGTSNSPIPKVSDRSQITKAQISQVHYSSHLVRGINRWRNPDPIGREEIWLDPDVRNYIKARDLAWPRRHPILGQFNWQRTQWCERYGDTRSPDEFPFHDVKVEDGKWNVTDRYIGSGLELVGIPESWHTLDFSERRYNFGILINEARNYGMKPEMTRAHAVEHYVKPIGPDWIHGTWPIESQRKLGMTIDVIPNYDDIFKFFQHTKCTFTTPSSGSHWATAKPWESFSNGTICFFHPMYDTQGHIIPNLRNIDPTTELGYLAKWLRVTDPDDLAKKVKAVSTSRETYEWLASAQMNHFLKAQEDKRCVRLIEQRLKLPTPSSSRGAVQPV